MRMVLNTVLFLAALATGLLAGDGVQAADKKVKPGAYKTVSKKAKPMAPKLTPRKVRAVKKSASPAHILSANNAEAWQDVRKLAVQSGAALVIEQDGSDALFQKNANAIAPIASITKLMTAMVVLDSTPDLNAPISISDDDVDMLRGSRSRLHVGSVMTRETALLLALMSSENRAAHALARHYPGGMSAFLAAMNVKAQTLGMRDTRFEDPTGLASSNVSTAHDLAKMVAAAHRYPLIREWSTMGEATVEIGGRALAFHNTNPLVKNAAWDVGVSKTGYIHEAGKCLVMLARLADRQVVIVLLDSVGKLTRVGDAKRIKRWMESVQAHALVSPRPATHAALMRLGASDGS